MSTFKSVLCVLALCAVPAAYTSARPARRVADDQQTADVLNQITDKIVAREAAEMDIFPPVFAARRNLYSKHEE